MSKAQQTLKVPVELVPGGGEAGEEAEAFAEAPLFDVSDEKTIAHVLVQRTDPDEGTLGRMPPSVTELDIKRRWGGGTFQLQARDERNRPMKKGFRTITIAGDPIFESKAAAQKWKRQQGLDENSTTPAAESIGVREIFALLSSTESKQKAEADRRAAELEAAHKRELERIKLEGEIRARERQADEERRERMAQEREERRRKEDEEREERRRRDEAEREERRRKDEESARQRDKEFQVALAQLNRKGSADGSEMLLKGVELMRNLAPGGGDSPDPVTAVATALLPGVLEKFGGKPAGGAPPTTPQAAAAARSTDYVAFDGPIGKKAQQVIAHLEREGFNPEDSISHVFDLLLKTRRQTAPAAASAPAAAPAPAPSSPPETAPPAPNATTRVKARTTKK